MNTPTELDGARSSPTELGWIDEAAVAGGCSLSEALVQSVEGLRCRRPRCNGTRHKHVCVFAAFDDLVDACGGMRRFHLVFAGVKKADKCNGATFSWRRKQMVINIVNSEKDSLRSKSRSGGAAADSRSFAQKRSRTEKTLPTARLRPARMFRTLSLNIPNCNTYWTVMNKQNKNKAKAVMIEKYDIGSTCVPCIFVFSISSLRALLQRTYFAHVCIPHIIIVCISDTLLINKHHYSAITSFASFHFMKGNIYSIIKFYSILLKLSILSLSKALVERTKVGCRLRCRRPRCNGTRHKHVCVLATLDGLDSVLDGGHAGVCHVSKLPTTRSSVLSGVTQWEPKLTTTNLVVEADNELA